LFEKVFANSVYLSFVFDTISGVRQKVRR